MKHLSFTRTAIALAILAVSVFSGSILIPDQINANHYSDVETTGFAA